MRYLLILILSVSCIAAQSQQINPVPDYIFRNQMSVGRNAVTDTAAYMSIGPRYGANKGLMPPIVVDTLTVTASPKRNGLLIFSVQKNKYVYWDSVRVQWSDMAGSSGSYIKGSGTIRYIPKFTDSITLGNSAMYDSSGFVRLYKNNIGNTFNHDIQTPVAGLTLVKDGMRGYPLIIQQNDSLVDNIQLAILLRKGLLVTDTIKNGYGVGLAMNLQNNQRTWVNSGWIANRIVDSAAATFKSEMAFLVNNSNSTFYPLIVRPDSTIRVLKLSGTGVRNVVADANGDLSIGSATNSVDTLSIATRAWRQKGDDSLGAIIATKQNTLTNPVTGTGTTNFVSKFTGTSTLGNSLIFDNGTNVGIGQSASFNASNRLTVNKRLAINSTDSTSVIVLEDAGTIFGFIGNSQVVAGNDPANLAIRTQTGRFIKFLTDGNNERMRITSAGDVGIGNTPSYKLDVTGTLRNTTGAAFATSSGNVLIGTTTDGGSYKLDVQGALRTTTGAAFATTSGNVGVGTTSPNSKLGIYSETSTQVGLNVFVANATAERTTYTASAGLEFSSYQSAAGGPFTKTSDIVANADGTVPSVMRLWTKASGASTPSERMRITAAGLVGIGNTAPTEALHVTGRIRATTIDSTATAMNMLYADATGVIKKAAVPVASGTINTAEADISSNYTVTATDHFVFLPALESAGRNVVLPNDAANGRVLIIFNTSNDGTYKWTFTNEDVEDAAGAAVTTLTNQKSYTMVYYAGKFRVTAIN